MCRGSVVNLPQRIAFFVVVSRIVTAIAPHSAGVDQQLERAMIKLYNRPKATAGCRHSLAVGTPPHSDSPSLLNHSARPTVATCTSHSSTLS